MDKSTANGTSVIICCYNSAARIKETLLRLQKQIVPGNFYWEIIIVNNASTDNTVDFIKSILKQADLNNAAWRIIDEPKQGQMHARITGAKNANYECLVFCDDDNLLSENYVFVAHKVLFKNKETAAVAGRNMPVTNAEAYPDWFKEYGHYYAIGIPAEQSGDITKRGFVLGAGLITKRSLFLKVFNEQYPSLLNGRNGEQLTTGDDFEYCKRLRLWGYRFYYDDRLQLDHFIPKERLTIDYRNRLLSGIMQSREILDEYDYVIRLKEKLERKSKLRLAIFTPVRILFIRLGLSKRSLEEEKSLLALIYSFDIKINPVKKAIIKFAKHL